MDCNPPGSSVHGILRARASKGTVDPWLVRRLLPPGQAVGQSSDRGSKHDSTGVCIHVQSLSCVRLFATPWTVTHQAPLSMGFSRQEYWSGLPFPSPGDLFHPGIKCKTCLLCLLCWQVYSLPLAHGQIPSFFPRQTSRLALD